MKHLGYVFCLTVALPALAEWREVQLTFKPTGCATCIDSLESRLMRVRGVKAALVDGERNRVAVILDDNNRIRLSRLLGVIEQDGTEVVAVDAKAGGQVRRTDGVARFFVSYGEVFQLEGEHLPKDGPAELSGTVKGRVWQVR